MGLRLKDDVELSYDEANQKFSIEDLNTAQTFEFNSDGSTSIEPAAHSSSHESGGSDALDLGSLDVLSDLDLSGNALTDSTQGFLDLTGDGNDLRLGTGQSLEDGAGDDRFVLEPTTTRVQSEDGERAAVFTRDAGLHRIYTRTGIEFDVFDEIQGNTGFRYTPSSTTGTLELSNADLDANGNDITNAASLDVTTGIDINTASAGALSLNAPAGDTSQIQMNWSHDGGTKTWGVIASGDLLKVYDWVNGLNRIEFSNAGDGKMLIQDREGDNAFVVDTGRRRMYAYSGKEWNILDAQQGKSAVRYSTGATLGQFILSNASLLIGENSGIKINQQIAPGSQVSYPEDALFWPDQGGGNEPFIAANTNGEIEVSDDAGNHTTLT